MKGYRVLSAYLAEIQIQFANDLLFGIVPVQVTRGPENTWGEICLFLSVL
jgi:hypothetical protein